MLILLHTEPSVRFVMLSAVFWILSKYLGYFHFSGLIKRNPAKILNTEISTWFSNMTGEHTIYGASASTKLNTLKSYHKWVFKKGPQLYRYGHIGLNLFMIKVYS